MPALSSSQSAALFDVLSHFDTYAEIRQFRYPGALSTYGPPFTHEKQQQSTAPILQALLSRFILTVPGLRDVPDSFWKVQIQTIIDDLENANLSESYDKGAVGSRKTLATAVSALIEYPVRGTFGGVAEVDDDNGKYDLASAEELHRGFRNFVDQCIYGTVLDELVAKAAETDKLEEHTNLIKAVHEFVLVNLASFMHYTLILSPKGQYLLKLVDNANKLIPYMAIRQTLKIGNIATMMGALVKIILAKMSVTSITNWIGLTASENDGINLLQQVISTVLQWDIRELESRLAKITKDKSCPPKDILATLDAYVLAPQQKQEEIRQHSQSSSMSIVLTILADAEKPSDFNDETHKLALDYLSCKLSIRDRNEITRVACYSRPDHLTAMVRALFDAYEPIIRQFHIAVDLSDTVADLQAFITDMLKVARIPPPGKDGQTTIPSVGDFVKLLKKHQYSSHKFIHQLCKNGGEVTQWYLDWAKKSASQFQRHSSFVDAAESHDSEDNQSPDNENTRNAGDLAGPLNQLFSALPPETQSRILPVLNEVTLYVDEMHTSSVNRLSEVLHSTPTTVKPNSTLQKVLTHRLPLSRNNSRPSSPARAPTSMDSKDAQAQTPKTSTTISHDSSDVPHVSSNPGPGAYLARWQDLLDLTPVTPLIPHGKVNKASDTVIVQNSATDIDGGQAVQFESQGNVLDAHQVNPSVPGGGTSGKKKVVKKPDISIVIDALGAEFRKLIAERSLDW